MPQPFDNISHWSTVSGYTPNRLDPELGKIHWPVAGIVGALREAFHTLSIDDWVSLDAAARWITEHHPQQTPQKYGCSRWRHVIHESRQCGQIASRAIVMRKRRGDLSSSKSPNRLARPSRLESTVRYLGIEVDDALEFVLVLQRVGDRPGTDMLPNDGRLQTGVLQNSVYTKICTRVVLRFRSYPCSLLAKGHTTHHLPSSRLNGL